KCDGSGWRYCYITGCGERVRAYFCDMDEGKRHWRKPLLTFSVHLLEPPRFIQMPTPIVALPTEVVKGMEATLECEVTGTPPFEVKWLKNNKEMFSSKKYAISTKESVFTLNVTNCDILDVGEYQCIISNEGGSCSCSTRLSLKGQPPRKHTPKYSVP
uniref:Ig-like domain-containing protein n=1 Tax=Apteryx owenii TaxID=8824 RepID=A0A8B9P9W1_APTOW